MLDKLREKRLEKRFSVTQMAKELGFSTPSGYANLESGRTKMTVDYAIKICNVLEEDPVELFFAQKLLKKSS